MEDSLMDVLQNYNEQRISGDIVHIEGIKNGKVVFEGNYQIYGSIETNYSRLFIYWPKDGVLPAEYQDHYGIGYNRYPVDFEYFEQEDKLYLSGKYHDEPYEIVIQLPIKRYSKS
ncbi:hypothetical protein MKX57_09445 [Lysinibacillus sp. FSL M8-0216]|uniref:hypothetical protein n=1 Tax=Lysinibacillus sp. FSL M8-0216 TaxID=2921619 RepID=UPI00315ACB27